MFAAPAYPTPAAWTNQDLVVYHGTTHNHGTSILAAVNVSAGKSRTDFGTGFYTTTSLPQARSWAYRLASYGTGLNPVVVELTISRDSLAGLECVSFVRGDSNADDFWSLVKHCRTGGLGHSRANPKPVWYDIAVGPLATTWRQRTCHTNCDQISFHTSTAESVLNASNRLLIP